MHGNETTAGDMSRLEQPMAIPTAHCSPHMLRGSVCVLCRSSYGFEPGSGAQTGWDDEQGIRCHHCGHHT
jgi:DNA-directed RNA polymerase subunit RPC12/RpoP